jgi:glycerol-3-phosphate acyltransferase PlsY
MPQVLLWTLIAFFCGSLPFSVWIGRLMLKTDVRAVGDHNPGATNVLRAGGRGAAALALTLDILKGALPVSAAYSWLGITGWGLVPVAIAPVAGHAFSPFLGFRGGKAVAVTGGVWIALTAWEGPAIGGLLLAAAVYVVGANGWAVAIAMSGMMAYLWFTPPAWNGLMVRPDRVIMLAIWLGQMVIILWKHRADFRHFPKLSPRKATVNS